MSMFETLQRLLDAEVDFVPYDQMKRDAVHVPVGPLLVPIASIDHLIAIKSGTGRGKDLIDIDELRKIQSFRS